MNQRFPTNTHNGQHALARFTADELLTGDNKYRAKNKEKDLGLQEATKVISLGLYYRLFYYSQRLPTTPALSNTRCLYLPMFPDVSHPLAHTPNDSNSQSILPH